MYIVKLAIADLAEYLADGKKNPDVALAEGLFPSGSVLASGPARVIDVTTVDDGYYTMRVVDTNGRRDDILFEPDASDWFVTTDKAVSELG